ncbi:uncharacterized protein LOC110888879 [Helianthus annuus]|uniref:uncharacterized protein LOC110888879 n=1 Tax=Helianthus annuus TaxID=4232 RepID=UPI000B909513|nr:uncharacterized protein LOC110888879 [Helianthus annuus]
MVNCDAGTLPLSHLGIPVGVNMKRIKFWKPVIDKITAKLSSWKASQLSFAGRLTLAKSVLGSLPSYYLSLFAAPKSIIERIEKIRRNFVWGISASGRKMRWIRWEFLLKARKKGGMGLGGIKSFNLAMLTKWWWRFLVNPEDLWVKVVGSIHKGNTNRSQSLIPIKKSIPGIWKDIGSADSMWLKAGLNLKDKLIKCGERWLWRSSKDEVFSVKQARRDFESAAEVSAGDSVNYMWVSWAPPKVNYLVWRALLGKVVSREGLVRRGVPISDSSCPSNIKELFHFLHNRPGSIFWKKAMLMVALATCWGIWKARNEKTFEGIFIPVNKSVDLIKEDAFLWIRNRSKFKHLEWVNWRMFDVSVLM